MEAEDATKRTRRRCTSPDNGDGSPPRRGSSWSSPPRTLFSVRNQKWRLARCVTASPVVEHLALAAADAFVACCNLGVLLVLRPSWFQEASDDVRSDVVELPKPSILYVAILSFVCGVGGAAAKALILAWCLSERESCASTRRTTAADPLGVSLTAEPLGGYCICPRVIGTLYCSWIFVVTSIFQLLGAPLDALPSSLLLGIFFATVGFLGPYAGAVAEACRSSRWETTSCHCGLRERNHADAADAAVATSTASTTPVKRGPRCLRPATAVVWWFLRVLDVLCLPLVFLVQKLRSRARNGATTSASSLGPQELGNLLVFLAVTPLVICGLFCLVSCILLPMDWPTVYVVYPSPLVMSITLSYPLACMLSFFLLLLLPVYTTFPASYARALPVLQALMLKPSVDFPIKSVTEDIGGGSGSPRASPDTVAT
ncbi:hypothetical protein cyc_00422 [Cyclospora cayetanensis]|uniref:Transmembrane protein n=1 Tax=Cyclospora cayetanensis TaxID=88456 RepID=A0A1D3D3H6_9EIME|nr:hypothetical protein cyc_00422 [Cyclospora cayetanensis]